ncbi:MAG: septal ring lytic transglycosylase RlpA family protein [Cyanobacteria bacterium P01_A01_bin.105]
MKYKLLTGLAAALILPALSPSSGRAQTLPVIDTASISPGAATEPASEPSPQTSLQPDATETPATPSDSLSAATDSGLTMPDLAPELVRTIEHPLDDVMATTLYLRDIPLLTFVGPEAPQSEAQTTDSARLASTFSERIDQMHGTGLDASTISARWNADDEQFEVMVGDEFFVTLDEQVTLPDSTGDVAEDTLQVTNRLRRLLGEMEPMTEIEGRPAPPPAPVQTVAVRSVYSGLASWYGPGFHGRRSASGEVFNQNAMTAAHRTLPFGTRVRVTNVNNGRQVIVRINDRGPFSGNRVIDLSAAAAGSIGLRSAGVGTVQIEVLGN